MEMLGGSCAASSSPTRRVPPPRVAPLRRARATAGRLRHLFALIGTSWRAPSATGRSSSCPTSATAPSYGAGSIVGLRRLGRTAAGREAGRTTTPPFRAPDTSGTGLPRSSVGGIGHGERRRTTHGYSVPERWDDVQAGRPQQCLRRARRHRAATRRDGRGRARPQRQRHRRWQRPRVPSTHQIAAAHDLGWGSAGPPSWAGSQLDHGQRRRCRRKEERWLSPGLRAGSGWAATPTQRQKAKPTSRWQASSGQMPNVLRRHRMIPDGGPLAQGATFGRHALRDMTRRPGGGGTPVRRRGRTVRRGAGSPRTTRGSSAVLGRRPRSLRRGAAGEAGTAPLRGQVDHQPARDPRRARGCSGSYGQYGLTAGRPSGRSRQPLVGVEGAGAAGQGAVGELVANQRGPWRLPLGRHDQRTPALDQDLARNEAHAHPGRAGGSVPGPAGLADWEMQAA